MSRAVYIFLSLAATAPLAGAPRGKLHLTITEPGRDTPMPCRVHLRNAAGEAVRAPGLPFWRDHFVCPGSVELELPVGRYTYEIERGPEYEARAGEIELAAAGARRVVSLRRLINLAADGWWAGELHVHRPLPEIELLMRAEDLYVAPVITWWNDRNLWQGRDLPDNPLVRFDGDRMYHVMAGEDEREGGAMLFFGLRRPLAITGSTREFPSPMRFVQQARREPAAWIDIEKPFWWDVPVWAALAQVDSIGIANNHMCRSQMYETEAWGKPRDAIRLPSPRGNGFWSQEIYYRLLNAGLRIAPSAGSASGVLPNPVGYNRVYVHLGERLDYDAWWQGLRAGRSFVTNGPLLQAKANGQLPGHVFTLPAGQEPRIELSIALTSRDPIAAVELVRNGRVERRLPPSEVAKPEPLVFTETGWFLIRAIADNSKTFRFASTAPFYVEIGSKRHRISRASAQFFLDWCNERMGRVKLDDPERRREVLEYHQRARAFWEQRVAAADAP